MDKVFISYTREDQAAARLIANHLQRAGFVPFFDMEALVAGDSWSNPARVALQEADAVLVLLSSHSRRSSWVQDDLQTALENKKLVVPVLLDEGAKQNWLWPLVAKRQAISLDVQSAGIQEQLDHLVSALIAVSQESKPAFSRASRPALERRSPSVWRTAAIAIVSAILGALVVWLLR